MAVKKAFFVAAMLLVVVAGVSYAAQTGKIVGQVMVADTGEPLMGANVVIVGTTLGATTGLDGNFFILNIPPGKYELKASVIGYGSAIYKNVEVSTDRTTKLKFELEETVLEAAEAVIFVSKRPMIRKDATDSRTTRTADDMKIMPVENIREIIELTAGTVGRNFRGGRATEVSYIIDGASFVDPMSGNYEGFVPAIAFEEVNVITGGQSVEYGNALSGVVHQVTKEGGDSYNGGLIFRTNDAGGTFLNEHDKLKDSQVSLGGPVPFFNRLGVGNLQFFGSGQYFDTDGRLSNDDSTLTSGFGKLTYKITPRHKLTFSGTVSNTQYTFYNHDYSRITNEDYLRKFSPDYWTQQNPDSVNGMPVNPYPYITGDDENWYGNGQVDTEDLNHNGVLDPGEDLDGNNVLDTEDLNHNFGLNSFDMQDHTPYRFSHTDQFAVKWNHTLNTRTFYEITLSRYMTELYVNTRERYNEDFNGNGQLDLEPRFSDINDIPDVLLNQYASLLDQADDGSYWIDFNQNGVQEWEDLNGNEIWDWNEYGPNHDMFRDDNNDGIIDASEGGAGGQFSGWGDGNWSEGIRWQDLVFNSNSKDEDEYMVYADGKTYHRTRWYNDYREVWAVNGNITSQIHDYHQIKSGVEFKFMEIFSHDVDMASGGNVYGENFTVEPRQYAIWAEDKMEFEGMVVNAGVRMDVFDPNWDNYPQDPTDPVVDPSSGGEVKDPVSVDTKYYWGPRFGVAFPITERDLLSFNYNRNFQIPALIWAFRNVNWDFSGAFPLVGNPNLDPEETTAYELTLRHQFYDDLAIVATGFYKDITGLTDTRQVFYDARNWYGLYTNTDYGNVRGFELSLEKRFSDYYSGNLSYTYAVAKGKSSSTRQNYENAWANDLIRTTESYLDWDQRHSIYGNVQFMIPRGTKLFNTDWLDEISLSLISKYGSGLPFSSPARDKDPPLNDKRLPYTLTFDGRMQKRYCFSDNLNLYAFLQVYNMFDRNNIDQRYFQDNADVDWYLNWDSDDPGTEPDKDVDGEKDNPLYWDRGRTWQFGIGFEF